MNGWCCAQRSTFHLQSELRLYPSLAAEEPAEKPLLSVTAESELHWSVCSWWTAVVRRARTPLPSGKAYYREPPCCRQMRSPTPRGLPVMRPDSDLSTHWPILTLSHLLSQVPELLSTQALCEAPPGNPQTSGKSFLIHFLVMPPTCPLLSFLVLFPPTCKSRAPSCVTTGTSEDLTVGKFSLLQSSFEWSLSLTYVQICFICHISTFNW